MSDQNINYQKILYEKDPVELLNWMSKEFILELPGEITSVEDMQNASKLMMKLTTAYSYLSNLLCCAKHEVRICKRACSNDFNVVDKDILKEQYEDMVDRRDFIESIVNVIKQQYTALSRCVTIRLENNKELQMGRETFYNH